MKPTDPALGPLGMSAAPTVNLRRSIVSLGAVNALDMALQVITPMLLVRALTAGEFGTYRLVWLLAGTALSLLPLAMPASLFYFLPRHRGAARAAYVAQAAWYMVGAGILGALASTVWLAAQHDVGANAAWQAGAFVGLWVFGSLLDALFNALQNNTRQASVNGVFALLRFAAIAGTAWVTHSLAAVLIAHLALGAIKAVTCAVLVVHAIAPHSPLATERARWREQLHYAAPFGASTGLYLLRGRVDQWLVAALFSAAQFGLYSVAAIFSPIQGLIRSTINNVVLPELNRLQAGSDLAPMIALNRRGNVAVAFVMFPILAFLAAAAGPLLGVLFTHDYGGAAAIVRVYCVMLLIESIEVTMLLTAFRQGPFLLRLDAAVLVLSLAVSALGAWAFGLAGAALGGLAAALLAQVACFRRCARLAGISVDALQPWGELARILAASAVSGCVAILLIAVIADGLSVHSTTTALVTLALAALAFGISYWLALRALRLSPLVHQVFGARLAGLLRI